MSKINLVDKRTYSNDYPKTNIVINSSIDCLNQKISQSDFSIILENLLKQQKDDIINIAINLAPSFKVAKLIWDVLSNIISYNNNMLFIPIISILGSKQDNKFKLNFDNIKLKNMLLDNGIIIDNIDIIEKLCYNLNSLKFSQLYNLNSDCLTESQDDLIEIKQGQAILLNYIIIKLNNLKHTNYDLNKYTSIKNKISTLLNEEQDKSLVTYTIPFEPISTLNAFNIGKMYYNDIRLHIELSDLIKKTRQSGKEPIITIENDEKSIKLLINSDNESSIINWELSLIDDFELIINKINSLLIDLQVEYATK
jgi:hypothetical protein